MADSTTVALVYVVSFFLLYVIATGVVIIFFRRIFVEEWRKRFMIRRGYGYVRINGNNKTIKEYFIKLTNEKIKIGNKTYLVDPKKIRFKDKAAIFEYKEGIAEPLDVYQDKMIGTDSEYLDGFLMKMKSLARVTAAKEMQMILLAAAGAAIMSAITAIICYTNYNTLETVSKAILT